MEKYFKRRVLKKIELKSSHSGVASRLPEDKLYFLCLVGTLLASIAHVDNHLDPSEKKALKACLAKQFELKGNELAMLFEVVEEQGRKGIANSFPLSSNCFARHAFKAFFSEGSK